MEKYLINRSCNLEKSFARLHIELYTRYNLYAQPSWKSVKKIFLGNNSFLESKYKY